MFKEGKRGYKKALADNEELRLEEESIKLIIRGIELPIGNIDSKINFFNEPLYSNPAVRFHPKILESIFNFMLKTLRENPVGHYLKIITEVPTIRKQLLEKILSTGVAASQADFFPLNQRLDNNPEIIIKPSAQEFFNQIRKMFESRVEECLGDDNLQKEEEQEEYLNIIIKLTESKTKKQIQEQLAKVVSSQIYLEEFIGAPVYQLKMEQEVKELVLSKSVPKNRYKNRPKNQDAVAYAIEFYSKYLRSFNSKLTDDAIYLDDIGEIEPALKSGLINKKNYDGTEVVYAKPVKSEKLYNRNLDLSNELGKAREAMRQRK